jgi:hypothetical protein
VNFSCRLTVSGLIMYSRNAGFLFTSFTTTVARNIIFFMLSINLSDRSDFFNMPVHRRKDQIAIIIPVGARSHRPYQRHCSTLLKGSSQDERLFILTEGLSSPSIKISTTNHYLSQCKRTFGLLDLRDVAGENYLLV